MDDAINEQFPQIPTDTENMVYLPQKMKWHNLSISDQTKWKSSSNKTKQTIDDVWNRLNDYSHPPSINELKYHLASLKIVQEKALAKAQNTFWGKINKEVARKKVVKKFASTFAELEKSIANEEAKVPPTPLVRSQQAPLSQEQQILEIINKSKTLLDYFKSLSESDQTRRIIPTLENMVQQLTYLGKTKIENLPQAADKDKIAQEFEHEAGSIWERAYSQMEKTFFTEKAVLFHLFLDSPVFTSFLQPIQEQRQKPSLFDVLYVTMKMKNMLLETMREFASPSFLPKRLGTDPVVTNAWQKMQEAYTHCDFLKSTRYSDAPSLKEHLQYIQEHFTPFEKAREEFFTACGNAVITKEEKLLDFLKLPLDKSSSDVLRRIRARTEVPLTKRIQEHKLQVARGEGRVLLSEQKDPIADVIISTLQQEARKSEDLFSLASGSETLFSYAIRWCANDCLSLLLLLDDPRVDPNQPYGTVPTTPLEYAISEGNIGAIQLLLDDSKKCNLHPTDPAHSPVYCALKIGFDEAVPLLEKAGADVTQGREIFNLKVLAAIFGLSGTIPIPGSTTRLELEGNTPYASAKSFQKRLQLFLEHLSEPPIPSDIRQKILESIQVGITLFSSLPTSSILRSMQSKTPIITQKSIEQHEIGMVICGDQLLVCNRGAGMASHAAIRIFHLENVDATIIDNLKKTKTISEFYDILKPPHFQEQEGLLQKAQKVGNCSDANLRSTVYALLYALTGDQRFAREIYKQFTAFSRGFIKDYLDTSPEPNKNFLMKMLPKLKDNPLIPQRDELLERVRTIIHTSPPVQLNFYDCREFVAQMIFDHAIDQEIVSLLQQSPDWPSICQSFSTLSNEMLGLTLAVSQHNEPMVRFLLNELHADVNSIGPNGNTPLLEAIENSDKPMVDLLLSLGASPIQAGKTTDLTPLTLAQRKGNQAILQLLNEKMNPSKP